MVQKNTRVIGTILVMMSSLGFSIGPTLAKHAYDSGANPLGVMTVRFLIASGIMLVLRQILSRGEPFPNRKIMLEMFLVGALGITIVSLTYFLAIETIDTGLAIVIWYCNPVIVVLITWLIYKKRPSRNIVFTIFFSLVGIAITTGQIQGGSGSAIALVLFSAFGFAIYLLALDHTLRKVDLLTGTTCINLGSALGYLLICLTRPFGLSLELPTSSNGWLFIATFALFGTVVPFLFSYAGMQRVGPSMLSVITLIEPVLAIAMGIIFLAEPITTARVVGATFVIGSLMALQLLEKRSEKTLQTNG